MEQQRPQEDVIKDWIKYTIQRFQDAQDKAGIKGTGTLRASFIDNIVQSSGGNISIIEIKFKYYLRFLDMGVGKGRTLASGKYTPNTTLYSKPKTSEVKALADILLSYYGIKSIGLIEENINGLTIDL